MNTPIFFPTYEVTQFFSHKGGLLSHTGWLGRVTTGGVASQGIKVVRGAGSMGAWIVVRGVSGMSGMAWSGAAMGHSRGTVLRWTWRLIRLNFLRNHHQSIFVKFPSNALILHVNFVPNMEELFRRWIRNAWQYKNKLPLLFQHISYVLPKRFWGNAVNLQSNVEAFLVKWLITTFVPIEQVMDMNCLSISRPFPKKCGWYNSEIR